MTSNGAQIEAARALLGWSQSELASKSGRCETTIAIFERDTGQPSLRNTSVVRTVFEAAGIEFTYGGPPV